MSINITKDINNGNTDYVSAFADNVLEFEETEGSDTARITVQNPFSTTTVFTALTIRGINGKFYFNARQILELIVTRYNLDEHYTGAGSYTNFDYGNNETITAITDKNSVFLIFKIDTINTDGSVLSVSSTQFTLRPSSIQIEDNFITPHFLHHKSKTGAFQGTLTLFEGYPFCISNVSENGDEEIRLHEINNFNNELVIDLSSQIYLTNRIPLTDSQGQIKGLLADIKDTIVAQSTWNGKTIHINIIKEADHCGGIYLKWLNIYGGWDYWLFSNNYKVTEKDRSIGTYINDFDNTLTSHAVNSSMGKIVERKLEIYTDNLNESDYKRISRVVYSPKVYLFVKDTNKFIEVFLSGKNSYRNTRAKGLLKFTITLPTRNTQRI